MRCGAVDSVRDAAFLRRPGHRSRAQILQDEQPSGRLPKNCAISENTKMQISRSGPIGAAGPAWRSAPPENVEVAVRLRDSRPVSQDGQHDWQWRG